MAKGRVETDVAEEAARQAWGARELLMRLGFDNQMITVKVGVPIGADQDKPIEERVLHACVELQVPHKDPFTIMCGPAPTARLFGKAMQMRMASIMAGVFSEAELARAFAASTAWEGRNEIVALMREKGFSLPSSVLLPVADDDPSRTQPGN